MLVKSQNKAKPHIMYNKVPLETVESFKYLGLDVPSKHRCFECATHNLYARKRAMVEKYNLGSQEMLFQHCSDIVLLSRVKVCDGDILKSRGSL